MKHLPFNLSLAIMPWLAQGIPPDGPVPKSTGTAETQGDIVFWLMVIVSLAIAVGLVGYLIYRRLKREVEEPNPSLDAAFSLSEMRRLYEAGEISHDEYMVIRNKLLGPAKAAMLGEEKASVAEQTDRPTTAPPPSGEATPPVDAAGAAPPGATDGALFEWEKEQQRSKPADEESPAAPDVGPKDQTDSSGDATDQNTM